MLFVRYNCRLHFGELFQPAKLDDGRSGSEGSWKIASKREISGLLNAEYSLFCKKMMLKTVCCISVVY